MTYVSVSPDRLVQQDLFREPPSRPPLVVADGMGVDSTALLIGLHREGRRPDLILFADTGNERGETYAYKQVRQAWLEKVGFPPLITVRYQPKDYKNWPPYHTLGENCLTNGTLPSLAFGFKSCSLKWKVAPQNAYVDRWAPAREAWRAAMKVQKVIGYDASPKDRRRYAHAQGLEDPKYEYLYPLIEWGWDRDRCTEEIRREGLPVPPKSACTFCPAMKPYELRRLKTRHLIEIVIMEARAAPRLRSIQGLWRNGCKGTRGAERRPGRMTDFIREEGLLPPDLIDHLIETAPTKIIRHQERFREGFEIPSWHDFLESFTPEDGTAGEEGDFIPLAVLDVEHMTERILSRQEIREPSLRYAA